MASESSLTMAGFAAEEALKISRRTRMGANAVREHHLPTQLRIRLDSSGDRNVQCHQVDRELGVKVALAFRMAQCALQFHSCINNLVSAVLAFCLWRPPGSTLRQSEIFLAAHAAVHVAQQLFAHLAQTQRGCASATESTDYAALDFRVDRCQMFQAARDVCVCVCVCA